MSKKVWARVAAGPTAPMTTQTSRSTGRKPLRRSVFKAAAAFAATGSLLLASAGVVHPDIIKHTDSVDAVAKVMPLNAGGPAGTTTLVVITANDDGKNGCNLTGSRTLQLNLVSSNPSVATVSPGSVTFTSCGDLKTLTVTPVGAGDTTVTATVAPGGNTTEGTFNLAPAAFAVKVAPAAPANTAPTLRITGVEPTDSYNKGAVPAAVCEITDAEDGPSTKPATLGPITGPDSGTGIGSQTASCSYTDKGGLTAVSDVTYTITDPTPPAITYTLNPAAADGLAGWYKNNVALTWTVTEPDSPTTLSKQGCVDATISADQQAQEYTCSATSGGGSAGPVTVSVKKDGTAPTVSYTSPAGTLGSNGWYTSDVTATFTATDATSGPAPATQTKLSEGEGAAVQVDSPEFRDVAGNITAAGAASATYKIDKTDPTATFNSTVATGYFGSIAAQPTCTATDALSGPASCVVTGYSKAVGTHTLTATATDMAGNTKTATQEYTVHSWEAKGFYQPVDMGGMLNTVKGGSTVPIKFELFAGSTELTDPSQMSFSMGKTACSPTAPSDDIETLAAAGSTSLRYDATAGHFIYNWKTPTGAGTCYALTMKAADGTTISAHFKLK
ncbi:PxKF domain-containing protein [Arthrobacter sp. H41]|uniref:PxKF domain-containing protein n=1 Tax=Arthrobacter sp. H41 TaxID=1312978 RepID=UPI0004B61604|nr:PxKF domain-containing protein [Arthrobacter sp. H41]